MVNNPYSELVNQFKTLSLQDPKLGRRLNELISINELLTTLNTARSLEEILDIVLLTILGQYVCVKGAVFIKTHDAWRLGISKGFGSGDVDLTRLPLDARWDQMPMIIRLNESIPRDMEVFANLFQLIFPVKNEQKLVGLICLGRSMLADDGREQESLLASIADFGGMIIGNNLYRGDLEQVNKQLQRQLFQLKTLYEISGSFARCLENDEVFQILANNLMGQFFISRCAVLDGEDADRVLFKKGIKAPTSLMGGQGDAALEQWREKVYDRNAAPCPSVNSFMKEHKLRYALPISCEERRKGILLLGDRLDRAILSEADREFVLSLAQQSAAAMENIQLQREAAEKRRMEKELQLAREIQQRLLPKDLPKMKGYELAVEMRPYYQVGGDFYDFFPLNNGKLAFCLADVSGKSLPASLIMSTAQASLRALNSFGECVPKEIIEKLNIHLWESTQSNKFITMFYAILDTESHELTYINAGHNRPILVRANGETELLDKGGMVMGLFPHARYIVGNVFFDEGTKLLVYSDGLSEVVDRDGEEYGDERLLEYLTRQKSMGPIEEEKDAVIREVMSFSSDTMVDDLTLLLIRRRSQSS